MGERIAEYYADLHGTLRTCACASPKPFDVDDTELARDSSDSAPVARLSRPHPGVQARPRPHPTSAFEIVTLVGRKQPAPVGPLQGGERSSDTAPDTGWKTWVTPSGKNRIPTTAPTSSLPDPELPSVAAGSVTTCRSRAFFFVSYGPPSAYSRHGSPVNVSVR